MSGFVSVESCSVDPRESSKARRDFTVDGIFLPLAEYWGSVETNPVVLQNSFGITMDDCICWTLVPRRSMYAAVGSTRTLASEYGTLILTSGYTHFIPVGVMDGIGEVRVFDGSTRIYSAAHLVDGILTVKNGLYSVALDKVNSRITVSYWSGAAYTKIDDFTVDTFSFLYIKACRPDFVEIVLSTGDEIILEACRPPMIDATLTCRECSPADQSTTADNFLLLDEGLYIASDHAFSITSGVIDGAGKKWILHATGDVEQEARNCLVDSQAFWYVERRW
ncbi:hypothetical protein [Methanosarcina sp.]|uniref:hypothetical protein n=1 Tax=Methanosarcina sp. TaxID=2213 RepID=UPI003BB56FDF